MADGWRMKGWLAVLAGLMVTGCQGSGQSEPHPGALPPATAATGSSQDSLAAAPASVEPSADFRAWLEKLRLDALSAGISARTLDRVLPTIRPSDKVQELDQRQPEFTRAIWQYLDSAISDKRVATGRQKLADHRTLLARVEAHYGVPAPILVAFWGVETDFGQITGGFKVLDALASLAWRGRRTGFFRGELLDALRILDAGDIAYERMTGSWAGAMGQTQFMPSIYLRYAVDGDGDGKRDIWGSLPDVFSSTARFVAASGWRRGESWGEEVRLPDNFAFEQADLSVTKPLAEWRRLGVTGIGGTVLGGEGNASILVPGGANGPALLVRDNFRAILRYNPATSYALAVALLSDRFQGGGRLVTPWPRHEQPLSRSETMELQRLLGARGHDAGTPDGVIGAGTRAAIRAYQRSAGLKPDGFATRSLLDRLR